MEIAHKQREAQKRVQKEAYATWPDARKHTLFGGVSVSISTVVTEDSTRHELDIRKTNPAQNNGLGPSASFKGFYLGRFAFSCDARHD